MPGTSREWWHYNGSENGPNVRPDCLRAHQAHFAQATLSSVFHVPCILSMASIDPTPEEMQQWSDISSVVSWAGLAGDSTETATPAGSFLRHLGFTSTAPVRVLGMISATDLTDSLRIGRLMVKTPLKRNAPRRHLWGVWRSCSGRYTANGR